MLLCTVKHQRQRNAARGSPAVHLNQMCTSCTARCLFVLFMPVLILFLTVLHVIVCCEQEHIRGLSVSLFEEVSGRI